MRTLEYVVLVVQVNADIDIFSSIYCRPIITVNKETSCMMLNML